VPRKIWTYRLSTQYPIGKGLAWQAHTKQIEAYASQEGTVWLMITVITRYY